MHGVKGGSKVLAMVCTVAPFAAAQAGWWDLYPAVTDRDMGMMGVQARQGLTGQPEGTVLEWSNPDSGHHGTVTLVKRTMRDGMECRTVLHRLEATQQEPWSHQLTMCQQPDGGWKVVSGNP